MSETTLPDGAHVATFTGHLAYMNLPYEVRIVWLDRESECSWCGQYVDPNPGCPVVVNDGAGRWVELMETNKQHHCGEWLSVQWREVDDGEDPGEVARLMV